MANILDVGHVVDELEQDLGVSPETIALAVHVDRRTIERWRANVSVPQGQSRERLAQLIDVRDQLVEMLGRETAQAWLRSPSRYLGEFTPEEALKAGRVDRVRADLDGLAAGIYL